MFKEFADEPGPWSEKSEQLILGWKIHASKPKATCKIPWMPRTDFEGWPLDGGQRSRWSAPVVVAVVVVVVVATIIIIIIVVIAE